VSDPGNPFARRSYAQEGEDLILERLFEHREVGFYVDVGAHHPSRFSNTRLLYDRGWRGINIDPTPGTKALFDVERPHDVNLELAVGRDGDRQILSCFNEGALNTLSESLAQAVSTRRGGIWHLVERRPVDLVSLSSVLERHVPAGCRIDLLSIDTEGWDLDVLRSNDWRRFAPDVVLTETRAEEVAGVLDDEIHRLLEAEGYRLLSKTFRTLFYQRR
jgi:FkbM family methyltransferase